MHSTSVLVGSGGKRDARSWRALERALVLSLGGVARLQGCVCLFGCQARRLWREARESRDKSQGGRSGKERVWVALSLLLCWNRRVLLPQQDV